MNFYTLNTNAVKKKKVDVYLNHRGDPLCLNSTWWCSLFKKMNVIVLEIYLCPSVSYSIYNHQNFPKFLLYLVNFFRHALLKNVTNKL